MAREKERPRLKWVVILISVRLPNFISPSASINQQRLSVTLWDNGSAIHDSTVRDLWAKTPSIRTDAKIIIEALAKVSTHFMGKLSLIPMSLSLSAAGAAQIRLAREGTKNFLIHS